MEARDDEREALADALAGAGVERGYVGAHRFRLMVADRLIAAGYRKPPEPEITDEMRKAAFAEAWGFRAETRSYGERMHIEGWFNRGWRAFQAALRVPVGEGEEKDRG